jgi:four helix bundle protein
MRHQELLAYKKSFALAMEILEISKNFPKEEVFALTSQIRRSSRAASSAIAEA